MHTQTQTHQRTLCRCDHCDFSSPDPHIVSNHEFEKHERKITQTLYWGETRYTLIRISDEQTFERWVKSTTRTNNVQVVRGDKLFLGARWYAYHITQEPCPRRCCTDNVLNISTLENLRINWRNELQEMGQSYQHLSKLIQQESA